MKTKLTETPTPKRKNGITKSASVTPNHGEWFIDGNAPPASSTSIISCQTLIRVRFMWISEKLKWIDYLRERTAIVSPRKTSRETSRWFREADESEPSDDETGTVEGIGERDDWRTRRGSLCSSSTSLSFDVIGELSIVIRNDSLTFSVINHKSNDKEKASRRRRRRRLCWKLGYISLYLLNYISHFINLAPIG